MQIASGRRLDREHCFVGFHFHDLLPPVHLSAVGDQPAHDGRFFDRLPQLGDEEFFGH
jgi:hypothetical protein